jgi:Uncharacterized conserved protein
MALWLVRAGKYGEYESHFLENGVVNLTWEGLEDTDLSKAKDYDDIKRIVLDTYPDERPRRLGNWAGQIWAFALGIKAGDWIALPRKTQSAIAIGEVLGPYQFDEKADALQRHARAVRWINKEVPRSSFAQDLLYSLGAFLTVCEVKRNDAEARVRKMATSGWKDPVLVHPSTRQEPSSEQIGRAHV